VEATAKDHCAGEWHIKAKTVRSMDLMSRGFCASGDFKRQEDAHFLLLKLRASPFSLPGIYTSNEIRRERAAADEESNL